MTLHTIFGGVTLDTLSTLCNVESIVVILSFKLPSAQMLNVKWSGMVDIKSMRTEYVLKI
jgi:hypothetical protein